MRAAVAAPGTARPEVVHVVDDPGARGRLGRPTGAGARHHGQPHRCGLQARLPVRHPRGLRLARAEGPRLGDRIAGVVKRVGPDVTRFSPGDRVFGYAEPRFGAHAELVAVAESSFVAPVPDGVDLRHAAAATEGGHYALSSIQGANVKPGSRVLVHGATGAIGSAAVQLLADLGAHVIATAPTAHVELVRGLGADRVVDFQTEDFTHGDETVDVVLDMVGKSTFGACRRLLTPRGVYLSSDLGPYAQNLALPLATKLGRGRRVVFPFPSTSPEVVEHLRSRLASGASRPLLDPTTFRLDIVAAYHYVETGQKLGNVLVTVDEP